ncbi:MAP kinase kinase [Aureococcus anophagefferens]|nr:MAP kinase kinase [Aureococcus anophagefferens]
MWACGCFASDDGGAYDSDAECAEFGGGARDVRAPSEAPPEDLLLAEAEGILGATATSQWARSSSGLGGDDSDSSDSDGLEEEVRSTAPTRPVLALLLEEVHALHDNLVPLDESGAPRWLFKDALSRGALHPCDQLVTFYGAYAVTDDAGEAVGADMVLEYMDGGSLHDVAAAGEEPAPAPRDDAADDAGAFESETFALCD